MTDRYKEIKKILLCAVEEEVENLCEVDAKELGEVIDMIKDLEEAEYYHTVTKAMKEDEGEAKHYKKEEREYIKEKNYMKNSDGSWTEKEYAGTYSDWSGKSHHYRKSYMEARESHADKTAQMKELEKYVQELTSDVVEMINEATPEEKQYLSKKIAVLANKVTQTNETH